jgi:uncharacterized repeat protein (TIGR03803 family)
MANAALAEVPIQETVLTRFPGGPAGAYPAAGLVRDVKGNLYGVTSQGGTCGSPVLNGVVFRLSPPAAGKTAWTETVLLDFCAQGGAPEGTLVMDASGALYGTAYDGGKHGLGTVFKLAPPPAGKTKWTATVLLDFDGTAGAYPYGGLAADSAGNLYGTTSQGGTGAGVVFKLTKPAVATGKWVASVLHRFVATSDGFFPFLGSLAIDGTGAVYGTNSGGGAHGYGTVFRLTPPKAGKTAWGFSVLYAFAAGDDGSTPKGGVILDSAGAVYGTTYGGTPGGWGSVFKLTPPAKAADAWTETQIKVFMGGSDGGLPYAALTWGPGGVLYGTASNVFALSPDTGGGWSYSVLHAFGAAGDGNIPEGPMILDAAGDLYGTTYSGGSNDGTVFMVAP